MGYLLLLARLRLPIDGLQDIKQEMGIYLILQGLQLSLVWRFLSDSFLHMPFYLSDHLVKGAVEIAHLIFAVVTSVLVKFLIAPRLK